MQDSSRDVQRSYPSQNQQQQPPSPSRKSMFEFVSAFDALSSPGSSQAKKMPEMSYNPAGQKEIDDNNWPSQANVEPKRKSVENLMDQLTRSQPLPSHPPLEPYGVTAPPPLPPKPNQISSPPRAELPALPSQQRVSPQDYLDNSALLQPAVSSLPSASTRDRAGSPPLRGGKARQPSSRGRVISSP